MKIISKIFSRAYWFFKIGIYYSFSKVTFKGEINSTIQIDKKVKIKNTTIYLYPNSSLTIRSGTKITNASINVKGCLEIGENNLINNGYVQNKLNISIDGCGSIGNRNRIQASISVRFGGKLKMGNCNNINSESEIRVDEYVLIGDYNQISYKVIIWDTNTHNIYAAEHRRKITDETFPKFGYEFEKPKTKPVLIGNDCWIGREVSILKGVSLADRIIVGYKTTISNCSIPSNKTITSEIKNKIIDNNI